MLQDRRVHGVLPTRDLDAARTFEEGKIGLGPMEVRGAGVLYRMGDGSLFAVSRSSGQATGSHTQLAFTVPDVEAEVRALRSLGIVFEEYDYPTLKTVNGVADMAGAGRAAWFKDPDGNIIGLIEFD